MSAPGPLRLDELDRLLKALDPGVVLVPPRLLRRIIKHDRQLPGIGLHVPHRKTYVCERERLHVLVEADELPLSAGEPAMRILLARPDPERLAELPRDTALLKFWRLLFHARVHLALEPQIAKLTDDELRGRIARLGVAEFDEVRSVLRQEEFLLPPADDRAVYVEFVAVYLDLRHFSPALLTQYFPGIDKPNAIDAVLAEDVDVQALLTATRLEGATLPPDNGEAEVLDQGGETPAAAPDEEAPQAELAQEAQGAAAVGNLVRAARLRMRAGDEAAALAHLQRLAQRLQSALQLHPAEADAWRRLLPALLPAAARGLWPPAARLLYDLQKVCMDHEHAVYKLDLVEWALSLGRRPIKRLLPGQQEVQGLRHLRSALKRLPTTRLADADRRELAGLLIAAIHHSEDRLRERFRPVLLGALEDVGLRPGNMPERVARHKLVEELLDRIGEHGFIHIGDLRDALSRNQLKLLDLADPGEFWHGDALLRLDQRLGAEMEGVYRRGEVYLRWLQRFSSVSFGTRVGRFLTRYVALPFGGAFVLLEGLQHVVEPLAKLFTARTVATTVTTRPEELPEGWVEAPSAEVPSEVHETAAGIHLLHWWSLLLVGFFLLGLMYSPSFRARVVAGLLTLFRGLRVILVDLPARLLRLPVVQRLLHSRWMTGGWQFVLKPLLVSSSLAFLGLATLSIVWPPFLGSVPRPGGYAWIIVSGVLLMPVALLLNSRFGRALQERLGEQVERTWEHLLHSAIPGIVYGTLDFFRACVEAIDRVMYSVDERLRFRVGDSRLSLYVKPVLGLFWFAVTYVVRFCVNLLIEPQVNPIKHFPVVTVSHKLVLTLGVPHLAHLLSFTFDLEPARAWATATLIGSLIPGIFGFLVWELKENWKLYRANRSPALKPTLVGSHGETLARLLRPGFHSGTVPKLFGKLRRAGRRARRRGRWVSFRKHRDALHHVEESVHHFIERELLQLLEESKSWGGLHVSTGALMLSTNRIRVELYCPELAREPVRIAFTERLDELLASIDETGWLTQLKVEQRRALTVALAGLCKLGGVDDVEAQAATSCHFHDVVISWDAWVEAWDADEANKGLPERFPGGECLPSVVESAESAVEVPVG
jgi:hypothetical protein